MIKHKCFQKDWLEQFKREKAHKRIDPIILEKMIYALHLLESLKQNGLIFVFKGGTSLVLLLKEEALFSIDIDIICNMSKEKIEQVLDKVIKNSRFIKWELDAHRSYQPDIPKAHYKFFFDSLLQGSGSILLDVLITDSIYPELTKIPIKTKWVETDNDILINIPTVDAITGDKLTAFAPNTIGIPYFKNKQSFSMEICKQLYDLSKLFEEIKNIETVATSFINFSRQEIYYRRNNSHLNTLTPEKVLIDTIKTCLIIAKRGRGSNDEKQKFTELQKGIKSFNSFLMSGRFRIDDAISASARIAYLAAKILVKDFSPINYYNGQNIKDINLKEYPNWNFLEKLKKQQDKSSFYYWYKTVQLLTKTDLNFFQSK